MKIKLYVDDVLEEECVEEGFVVNCSGGKTNMLDLFSDKEIIFPYSDKSFQFPNGVVCTVRISTSPAFHEACEIMSRFKGLIFLEIREGNAKLQIEY